LAQYWNKDVDLLSTEETKRIIDRVRALGVLDLVFFGGEPLLRKDIVELIKYTRFKGLLPFIFTNGILLSQEKFVRELKEAGLYKCNVSINSSLSEKHDRVRGYKGCFEMAIKGISNLVKEKIRCTIWTYASKEDVRDNDLRDLKNLIQLGQDLKVNNIKILFPIAGGNWFCAWEEMLTREERNKVRSLVGTEAPFVELEFPQEESYCQGGKFFFYVSPEGNVSPCPGIPFSYGNVRKESFTKILSRMSADLRSYFCWEHGECIMQDSKFRGKIFK